MPIRISKRMRARSCSATPAWIRPVSRSAGATAMSRFRVSSTACTRSSARPTTSVGRRHEDDQRRAAPPIHCRCRERQGHRRGWCGDTRRRREDARREGTADGPQRWSIRGRRPHERVAHGSPARSTGDRARRTRSQRCGGSSSWPEVTLLGGMSVGQFCGAVFPEIFVALRLEAERRTPTAQPEDRSQPRVQVRVLTSLLHKPAKRRGLRRQSTHRDPPTYERPTERCRLWSRPAVRRHRALLHEPRSCVS
jgi:hypothetical protein